MKKILVIEDDKSVRQMTLYLLNAVGYQAIGAENGRTGLRLAEEQQPDLILCDIIMPEMDGYAVLTSLQQNPATVAIPFIFLTAKSEKRDLRQGMELGADDYLTKPFTRDELVNAVTSRLAKQTAITGRPKPVEAEITPNPSPMLPSRISLAEQLQSALHDRPFVPTLAIRLDRFDRLSSNLGQARADRLVQAVTQRLLNCLNNTVSLVRWQADQLVILLPGPVEKREVEGAARFILANLAQPFDLEGQDIYITASIGIAFYPTDSNDLDSLIDRANMALYQATLQGGNNYQFYTLEMQAKSRDQLELEADMYYALEREEFQIYYQPQIDLHTRQIGGVEALIRWQHPQRGMISPIKFIPLAEENGLIIPIGSWSLRNVCWQAQKWQHQQGLRLRMGVNLSARQFSEASLSEKIAGILQETGLDPRLLEVELTESTLVQNVSEALSTIKALKQLGVQIALDDFGTGYSSLSYLNQFPFDSLKIDQSFVRNIENSPENRAIILATLEMARRLNLRVIAEGVETEAELAFLREHGCDEVQGYLFGRPVPPDEFEKLLNVGRQPSPNNSYFGLAQG